MSFWDRFPQAGAYHEVSEQKWLPGPVPDEHDHYAKTPRAGTVLYCASCCEDRPWFTTDLCDRCLTQGPPEQDPAASLTGVELTVLESLAQGHDLRQVARISHLPLKRIEQMLEGRDTGRFRRTWQLLLEANGVTLPFLAQRARESLDATDKKWHPEEKDFIDVIDNKTRLNATKWLASQHEVDPEPKSATQTPAHNGVFIQISTNLGDESTKQQANADYTFDVTPLAESEPSDAA